MISKSKIQIVNMADTTLDMVADLTGPVLSGTHSIKAGLLN